MALFKQMIGRGTRLFPDDDKLTFDIIDYSGATALFEDPEFDGPPERVDVDEIDDEGTVVEPPSSRSPSHRSSPPTAMARSTPMTRRTTTRASSTSTTPRCG